MTDTRITDFEAVAPMPIYTQADLDAAVQKERGACRSIAANYGPNRPIVSRNPSPKIFGRWEGEQAASMGIAMLIEARGRHD